jgi:hypothetical protein
VPSNTGGPCETVIIERRRCSLFRLGSTIEDLAGQLMVRVDGPTSQFSKRDLIAMRKRTALRLVRRRWLIFPNARPQTAAHAETRGGDSYLAWVEQDTGTGWCLTTA